MLSLSIDFHETINTTCYWVNRSFTIFVPKRKSTWLYQESKIAMRGSQYSACDTLNCAIGNDYVFIFSIGA